MPDRGHDGDLRRGNRPGEMLLVELPEAFRTATAAREHENDRIHATICTLPDGAAALVEMLLPEQEWEMLGLHGLNERMRQKRISALVRERLMHRAQFNDALRSASDLLVAWSRLSGLVSPVSP